MSDDTLIDLYCHISPARFFEEMNKVGAEARQYRGAAARRAQDPRSRCALSRNG